MAHRESALERLKISDDIDNLSDKSDSTVKANPQTNPRYLYYRLYTEEIAIPSKRPAFLANLYLGRVRAKSIAPPQTVLLIKRCLCKIEDISNYPGSTLFLSGSSRSPMDDGTRVSIFTPGGPGSTPEEPVELIVKLSYGESSKVDKLRANKMSPQPQYLYYTLYKEDGEIPVKHPITSDADDSSSVGRIDNYTVPPPHTVNSIIRRISHAEGFTYNFWHRLFIDIASESPINDSNVLILRSGGPGSIPESPLAFVRSGEMTKCIQATRRSYREGFLSLENKDTLFTDGVVRREASTRYASKSSVYRACNAAGQHGFVRTDDVTFY